MSGYRVGTALVNITPPVGMPFLAWRPRHQPIRGVHDELVARAAYVEADERVIIVSADTIGFADTLLGRDRSFIGEIKERIEQATAVPPSHIMIASNHIHSSAETLGFRPLSDTYPKACQWLEKLQDALVQCAVSACEETFDARLHFEVGSASCLVKNRRGDDCVDEEVTVLMFESDRGPELVMVSFACHPVIMQVTDQVSADYVGVATYLVEQTVEGLRSCMFLQGACGDIDPSMGDSQNYSDAENLGLSLAGEVLRLVGLMRVRPAPTWADVHAASSMVEFPSRSLPSPDDLPPDQDNEEALARIAEGSGPFIGEVQVILMGSLLLIGMPGEVFCSTGRALKDMPAYTVVPVGYANGYLGYFAPPRAWEKGGYEVRLGPWSKVSPEADRILQKEVRQLVFRVLHGM